MRLVSFLLLSLLLHCTQVHGADHAVVLLYHHVSSETPPSTSVTPEAFQQHLDYLEKNAFVVLPLSQVLQTLATGGSLPDKTVSITFDDAYISVLDQAMPMLRKKKWPYTVFVNTEAVDKGYGSSLDWDSLRVLIGAGAEVGNHSHSHAHLVRRGKEESEQEWQDRVTRDIALAQKRLSEELEVQVTLFAYPFGEHTPDLQQIVNKLGLFGIAQQSGAVGRTSNMLAIPRYPMATNYADMRRFGVSVHSRPLPVVEVSAPPSVLLAGTTNQYGFSLILQEGGYQTSALACYSSSGEKLAFQSRANEKGLLVSMQLPDWKPGRRKVNCTAPSEKVNGVYYWYSHLWLVRKENGQWYTE